MLEQKRFSGEGGGGDAKGAEIGLEAGLAGIQAVTSALEGASGAFETRP